MTWIIVGAIAVLAGGGLYLGSLSQKKKLGEMQGTETTTAAGLAELAAAVAKDIGPGSFTQPAEMRGTIECAQPLVSELAGASCVHYAMSVTREYEETYWETDDKGIRTQRTRRGSETVASNARSVPFLVRDATGTIAVEPDGAKFVEEKVFSQFQQGEGRGGMRFGSFAFDPGRFAALAGGRRTLGYRLEETAVPVGRQVYVLGEAADSDGRLRVRKPEKKGSSFIVSLKSEEQLVQGAKSASKWLLVASVVVAIGGAALVVLAALGIVS